MNTISRTQWFETVNKVAFMWDRKDSNNLVLRFPGYKCENYFVAQEALMALGGMIMTEDFDRHSGHTVCIVREPRQLEPAA